MIVFGGIKGTKILGEIIIIDATAFETFLAQICTQSTRNASNSSVPAICWSFNDRFVYGLLLVREGF